MRTVTELADKMILTSKFRTPSGVGGEEDDMWEVEVEWATLLIGTPHDSLLRCPPPMSTFSSLSMACGATPRICGVT